MKTEHIRLIQRFIDKELDINELSQFKKRYSEDPEFAYDVKQFMGMIIGIRGAEKKSKHNQNITRFLKPMAIAATLLLLISVGYLIVKNMGDGPYLAQEKKGSGTVTHNENTEKDTVVAKEIRPNNLSGIKINYLAANYKSNATIDNLIQQNYRSSSEQFEVLSPSDSAIIKVNHKITFSIKSKKFEPYTILIYNNRFNKVFESKTLDTDSNKLNTGLSIGLYYWKIKSASQSQWCGRIYVVE
jgi:hypothetical protein